ncbi:MAG TPA: response regulator [Desulfobacteraceae bacterium]|jgi:two-component system, OmpR family, alkaline phosphatase synthesis response regulator PhoP|nr:response regulator [Desulfobacteraceae bacterium]
MGSGKNILVIEDDRDLVKSIAIILESRNYRVRTAYNGKEGFAEIEKELPDLILLDIMMATDTDGFDLAYKLKKNPKYQGVPIVIMTSFLKKVTEEGPEKFQHILGESWPASHFFEKPIEPERLLSTVEKILEEEGNS